MPFHDLMIKKCQMGYANRHLELATSMLCSTLIVANILPGCAIAATPQDASSAGAIPAKEGGAGRTTPNAAAGSPQVSSSGGEQAVTPASAPRQNAQTTNAGVEEIFVTAQKTGRSSAMQTPVAMSVITARDLDRLAATKFSDFADTIPGLHYTSSGQGVSNVNIRGVTTGTDISPTVGFYIDDVPYGSSTAWGGASTMALDTGLFDLQQVEVLRGPQGTLYGASTMGGLVNYRTSLPNLDHFAGNVRSGVENIQGGGLGFNGGTSLTFPILKDKLGFRISDYYYRDPGYVNDVGLGRQAVNKSNMFGIRGELYFKPTEHFDMRVTAFGQNIERLGNPYVDTALPQSGNSNIPLYGKMSQYDFLKEPFQNHFRVYSGEINYRSDAVNITSISSWQNIRSNVFTDYSFYYAPILTSVGIPTASAGLANSFRTNKFTEELRFSSHISHLFDWLVGGFFTHEKTSNVQTLTGWAEPGQQGEYLAAKYVLPSTYLEAAAFGNLTLHVTSKLDISGGIRYSYNQQWFHETVAGGVLGGGDFPPINTHQNVILYMGNISYKFNQSLMLYGRVASGYRPGGPNAVAEDPVTHQYAGSSSFTADKLVSYEVGFKGTLLHKKLLIDADAFLINWRNMQIPVYINGYSLIGNAGAARIMGIEGTVTYMPIDHLRIVDSISLNQGQLTTNEATNLGGYSGDQLPNSPRFTNSFMVDYSFTTLGHKTNVGANVNYIGPRVSGFNAMAGAPQYRLGDYTTLGLHGEMTLGRWNAQVYLHNLNNSRGVISAQTLLGYGQVTYLQPRTAGFNLNLKF